MFHLIKQNSKPVYSQASVPLFDPYRSISLPPQLVNITENYMALMGDNGEVREDLRVPESEVGKEIEAKFEAGDDFMVNVYHFTAFKF